MKSKTTFKEMWVAFWKYIFGLFGFSHNTKYVKRYLNQANLRSALFMSGLMCVMEIWMIVRRFIDTISLDPNAQGNFFMTVFFNTSYFWLLLCIGLAIVVFCSTHLYGKKPTKGGLVVKLIFAGIVLALSCLLPLEAGLTSSNPYKVALVCVFYGLCYFFVAAITTASIVEYKLKTLPYWAGVLLIAAFSAVLLAFGYRVSYSDYTNIVEYKEIICFLTMAFVIGCMLVWKPYVSILMVVGMAVSFRLLIDTVANPAIVGADKVRIFPGGDEVNYIIFFAFLAALTISIYNQRVREAKNSELLEGLARNDSLTGLRTYSSFINQAEALTEQTDNIYLFIDIADFKLCNELRGFEAGNNMLKNIGAAIQDLFPDGIISRQGDDHFAALVPQNGVEAKLTTLRGRVIALDPRLGIDIAVGAYRAREGENPRNALEKARLACRSLKGKREVIYCEYDKSMTESYHRRQYVITTLTNAIEKGYIRPYYQPVMSAKDGTLCGSEALARWIDPELGFLSPGDFVPVLEAAHLIHRLDRAIIRAVCIDIKEAMDKGIPVLPVSINFSRLDFELMDVVTTLEKIVAEVGIPKKYLHVEVTESALTDNANKMSVAIAKLRELGYALWLDDFGSGYSSMNVLQDYTFDVLKIDMKFLSGFSENPKSKTLLTSIISMANSLGMNTVAEGVEAQEEVEFLKNSSCDMLQGYYFGKPMPKADLMAAIESKKFKLSKSVKAYKE